MSDAYNAGAGGPMDRALRRMRGESVPEPHRTPNPPAGTPNAVEEARESDTVANAKIRAIVIGRGFDNTAEVDELVAAVKRSTLAEVREHVAALDWEYSDGRMGSIPVARVLVILDAMEYGK